MNKFPKIDKLCGQLRIQQLYQTGTKMTVWPLRVTYQPADRMQVLVWAPKSLYKHAVDRNRLRRQMREAWRLTDKPKKNYQIAFNYMDKQMQPYPVIEKAMHKAVCKIDQHETTVAQQPS
ncbi:MAG: ribonuclease P protein component [Paludibacteraceae bacterium]|nr:ribonuclease P protein component [Paludibacteraceae bacterium]